jgi:hypothetical protein
MIRTLFLFFLGIMSWMNAFDKVVIWGHKLHSHTHSYIHNGFFRAFQQMGYPVFWFDDNDVVDGFDFSNALFLTEGQVDKKIPIRMDCAYILHNCAPSKYRELFQANQAVIIQVYTHDVPPRSGCKEIEPFIYADKQDKCLYMPWATDLLPHEIDQVKRDLTQVGKGRTIVWVGTIGEGKFGNKEQLQPFFKAAKKAGYPLEHKTVLSMHENMQLVKSAYMAPTIVGKWQQEQGYIPCRIFKSISYGQMGITNSETVYKLFNGKIVYSPDTRDLFFKAQERLKTLTLQEMYELMDFVRDHHTYINRIQTILDFFRETQT